MYGILAACVAVMAMFLALFAMTVEPEAEGIDDHVIAGSQKAGADHQTERTAQRR